MSDDVRGRFLQVRVDVEFLQKLDDMRRRELLIPSRGEMVRRILNEAFDAQQKTPHRRRQA